MLFYFLFLKNKHKYVFLFGTFKTTIKTKSAEYIECLKSMKLILKN